MALAISFHFQHDRTYTVSPLCSHPPHHCRPRGQRAPVPGAHCLLVGPKATTFWGTARRSTDCLGRGRLLPRSSERPPGKDCPVQRGAAVGQAGRGERSALTPADSCWGPGTAHGPRHRSGVTSGAHAAPLTQAAGTAQSSPLKGTEAHRPTRRPLP